jgi:hypothetical protein
MEQLTQILFQGANELAVFYTYMSMILRRASPESITYSKCLQFCATLAQRLNEDCQLQVVEAQDGMPVENGCIYIAPGGFHLRLDTLRGRVSMHTTLGTCARISSRLLSLEPLSMTMTS